MISYQLFRLSITTLRRTGMLETLVVICWINSFILGPPKNQFTEALCLDLEITLAKVRHETNLSRRDFL